jgi:tetratricopeptide (TPR) repeat protein
LFVEELTRAVVDGDGEKTREQVPATLHDSLLARLDRLGRGREVVGVAAVIGREFAASQVQRIAGLDADALGGWLTMLVGSGVIRPASESGPGTYRFKHALVRDAAYQSLLLTDRRRLHQAVADDLRAYRPAAGEAEPEVLARHYGEAGQFEAAARFWRRAARRAEGRGSLPEAVECAQAAISMLERLPASAERDERELSLLLRLGFMLYQRFGGGDERIGHILERTRKMASGNPGAQAFVLGLAATVFHDRAEHEQNVDVTSELIALAEDAGDPYWKMAAYAAAATPRLELGRVSEAEAVLDRFLEHYRPEMHVDAMTDPAINGHTERAWVRWHRGQPDLAIAGLEELIASLPESALRYARAHLAIVMAMLRVLRREPDEARRHALVAASFADEHSLDHIDCHAQFILGWEAATRGEGDSAVDMVSSALDRHRALGIRSGRERGLTMLALACQAAGRVADARAALHEGQALALETGARREAPELWRIEAELALADGLPDRAVALAGQAATMARDSESLGYELRALTTLAQLQPNATTVRDELSAVYAAFRDGHTTADLRDAALALGLQQPNGWPGVTLDAPGVKDQRST